MEYLPHIVGGLVALGVVVFIARKLWFSDAARKRAADLKKMKARIMERGLD